MVYEVEHMQKAYDKILDAIALFDKGNYVDSLKLLNPELERQSESPRGIIMSESLSSPHRNIEFLLNSSQFDNVNGERASHESIKFSKDVLSQLRVGLPRVFFKRLLPSKRDLPNEFFILSDNIDNIRKIPLKLEECAEKLHKEDRGNWLKREYLFNKNKELFEDYESRSDLTVQKIAEEHGLKSFPYRILREVQKDHPIKMRRERKSERDYKNFKEILKLSDEGLTPREVANETGKNVYTVKKYLRGTKKLYGKLDKLNSEETRENAEEFSNLKARVWAIKYDLSEVRTKKLISEYYSGKD